MVNKLQQLLLITLTSSVLLVGCGSNDEPPEMLRLSTPESQIPIPKKQNDHQYKVLMFGNSHVEGLPKLITALIELGEPEQPVYVQGSPSRAFLADRVLSKRSINALTKQSWTHVIFQGQKYSQSGKHQYPTIATQVWISRAKQRNIIPILFPEHPQKNNPNEARIVHNLHKRIASKEPSCIAPVGLVWDEVLAKRPDSVLHHIDGNHASMAGKFLTALVFYQVITGKSAKKLPAVDFVNVSNELQQVMRESVSNVLQRHPPC